MSNIFNYLIIQLFDIPSISNILNHLIIHLSDISGISNIVNYLIIQLFDISSISDIVNYEKIRAHQHWPRNSECDMFHMCRWLVVLEMPRTTSEMNLPRKWQDNAMG